MTNPLRSYLDREDVTAASFAERISVSPSFLSRLMSGEREADASLLAAIRQETGGSVTPDAWVAWYAQIGQAA
jgi:transcriptional regulator with XRE-family HTH domain